MKTRCTHPFTVTRFVAVPLNGEPRSFETEAEARHAAYASAKRAGAADFYRVIGEPATDIWQKPELLGGFELVEDEAAEIAA